MPYLSDEMDDDNKLLYKMKKKCILFYFSCNYIKHIKNENGTPIYNILFHITQQHRSKKPKHTLKCVCMRVVQKVALTSPLEEKFIFEFKEIHTIVRH